jgi:hypothetical protein
MHPARRTGTASACAGFSRLEYECTHSFAFEVSRDELEMLAQPVGAFRERAERACRDRLAELAAAARMLAGGDP